MRLALAVALVTCACRSKSHSESERPEAAPTPSAPIAITPIAIDAAPADEWTWQRASKCLDDIELPVPPQWRLREMTMADDKCMSNVSPVDRNGVNIERSTTSDLATLKAGLAKSWTIKSTLREDTTDTGWFLAVEVENFRPLVYAHRSDLQITCIGVGVDDLEIVRRVCAEARRTH